MPLSFICHLFAGIHMRRIIFHSDSDFVAPTFMRNASPEGNRKSGRSCELSFDHRLTIGWNQCKYLKQNDMVFSAN